MRDSFDSFLESRLAEMIESPLHERVGGVPECETWSLHVDAIAPHSGYCPFVFTSGGNWEEDRFRQKQTIFTGIWVDFYSPPDSTCENRQWRETQYVHPQIGDVYKVVVEDDKDGDWRIIYTYEILGDGTIDENEYGHTITWGGGGVATWQSDDYSANGDLNSIPPVEWFEATTQTHTELVVGVVVPEGEDPGTWDPESLNLGYSVVLSDARTLTDAYTDAQDLLDQVNLNDDTNKYPIYQYPAIGDALSSLGDRWLSPFRNDINQPGGTVASEYFADGASDTMLVHYMRTASGLQVNLDPHAASSPDANWGLSDAGRYFAWGLGYLMVEDGRYVSASVSLRKSKWAVTGPRYYWNINSSAVFDEYVASNQTITFDDGPLESKVVRGGIAPPAAPEGETIRIPEWFPAYAVLTPDDTTWEHPGLDAIFCP